MEGSTSASTTSMKGSDPGGSSSLLPPPPASASASGLQEGGSRGQPSLHQARGPRPGWGASIRDFLRAREGFLREQVKLFGVMQILIGVAQVTGGVPLAVSAPLTSAVRTGTPWWTGMLSIVTGVFTVRSDGRPSQDFKWTLVVINAVHVTNTVIAAVIYGLSTCLSSTFALQFLPDTPLTLTCSLLGFCVWNLAVTVPVCVVFYEHHPRVRRRHLPR